MEWFKVSTDDERILLEVSPPGGKAWSADISWGRIIRVCYRTGDFIEPDEIYIFVDYRPESFLIPSSAVGADRLWGGIVERGLFDAKVAIELMSTSDTLECFPKGS